MVLSSCVSASRTSPEDQRRIAELEEENSVLRTELDTLRKRLDLIIRVDPVGEHGVPPPIDALVLEVSSEPMLVVLDKGEQDGVELGFVFDLYLGSTCKGQVRITEVQRRTSTGTILFQKHAIARGDSATTQL
jgi:hypothetical protein